MKYLILTYASQQDYDAMSGKPESGEAAWSSSATCTPGPNG